MVDTDDTRRTTDVGRRTTNDGRRTTPWVWHKLPTGELIIIFRKKNTALTEIAPVTEIRPVSPNIYLNNIGLHLIAMV